MFLVRAHTNLGQAYSDSVAQVLQKEQLGGIVLFQGGPVRHANLINRYQRLAKVPLLVAMDGEWGLGMRMPDSAISYPYQMTLGAIQDNHLLYDMGREVAKDFKRLGININFAPVVDINNNPRNPVINYRSFGENKENVARKGEAYMKGMMDEGIIVSLKHFPGHGDTDVDSHYDLPTLNFSKERLSTIEMYPFKKLIEAGAPGIMVAHLGIPSLDAEPHLPSSLSRKIITDILRQQLGFKGIVFTDAMDMKGVVKYFKNGEADVRAIIAGSDVLELSQNSNRAIKMVKKAIRQKRIDKDEIEGRVKKILATKYWLGLNQRPPITTKTIYSDIHRSRSKQLIQTLADHAITLLNNKEAILSLDYTKKTALVSIGTTSLSTFQKRLISRFDNAVNFLLDGNASADDVASLSKELSKFDQVIIALHDIRSRPRSTFDYNNNVKLFISAISNKESIFCIFGNPYTLASLPGIEASSAILMAYQNDDALQIAVAKAIMREIEAQGKLPVTINAFFKYNDGN